MPSGNATFDLISTRCSRVQVKAREGDFCIVLQIQAAGSDDQARVEAY